MKQFIISLLAVSVVVVALRLYHEKRQLEGVETGVPAPEFAATTVDGQIIRLSDLRGKVVVLDFWATWCGPCRAMVPHERELVKKHVGQPFVFLGISADKDRNHWRNFLREQGMTWPNVCEGPDGPIQQLYQVTYYPTIFVLDAEGVIRDKDVRGHDLEQAVERLLAGTAK